MTRMLTLALLASSVLAGCMMQRPAERFMSDYTLYETHALTTREGPRDAPAVVLLDRCHFELVFRQQKMATVVDCHRAVRINSALALPLANPQIYVGGGELVLVEGRTIKADGTSVWLEEGHLKEVTLLSSPWPGYEDRRSTIAAFPDVEPGDIIELHHKMVYPTIQPTHVHTLDPSLPIVEAQFELTAPKELDIQVTADHFGERSDRSLHSVDTVSWRVRDYEPPIWEPMQPSRSHLAPRVIMTVVGLVGSDAPIVGSWHDVLERFWASIEPGMDALVLPVADAPEGDAVTAVWNAVQRIASRGPAFPKDRSLQAAWDSGFATPDERALMMLALLRRRQVKAGVVLAPSGSMRRFEVDHAWPPAGADFLVYLPDRKMLLDPGCEGCRPGELRAKHIGQLMVWGRGTDETFFSGVIKHARSRYRPSVKVSLDVEVSAQDVVAREGVWSLEGLPAAALRRYFAQHPLPEAEKKAHLRQTLLDAKESEAVIGVAGLEDPTRPIEVVAKNLELTSARPVVSTRTISLTLADLRPLSWLAYLETARRSDLQLPSTANFDHRFVVRPAPGQSVSHSPEAVTVATKWGHYERTSQEGDDGAVVVTERFELSRLRIPADRYDAFEAFASQVRDARMAGWQLTRGPRGTP